MKLVNPFHVMVFLRIQTNIKSSNLDYHLQNGIHCGSGLITKFSESISLRPWENSQDIVRETEISFL